MLNYIRSECYRGLRRKGYLFVLLVSVFVGLFINLVLFYYKTRYADFAYGTVDFSLAFMSTTVVFPMVLTILFVDWIFSNENRHKTLKNVTAFGFSRETVYLGKFLTELLFATAGAVLIFGVYVASGAILLDHSPVTGEVTVFFGRLMLGCFPLWMGGLAIYHAGMFLFKNETKGTMISAFALAFLPQIFNWLAMAWPIFGKVRPYFLMNAMKGLGGGGDREALYPVISGEQIGFAWAVGMAHVVIFMVLGLVVFRKKEL